MWGQPEPQKIKQQQWNGSIFITRHCGGLFHDYAKLVSQWVSWSDLQGSGCGRRHLQEQGWLKGSPRHGEKLRKAALWSSRWDLQATQRLGEASLCNSVEVVYYFHDIKLVRSSSSPSHVMFVYFLSLLSHTSPWWRGWRDASIQRKLLCKRRAFRSKVWFSWVLNDGGWESIFTPHPQISQVTSWSHWSPVEKDVLKTGNGVCSGNRLSPRGLSRALAVFSWVTRSFGVATQTISSFLLASDYFPEAGPVMTFLYHFPL